MGRPKKYNQKFFEQWTSSMAYILGFLFADGNIVKNKRGGCYIAFHTADKKLLLSMRSEMVSHHKVSKRSVRSGNVYRLQIGSKKFFSDLYALGLSPGKARRMNFPNIPNEFLRDFIRGYFDGDGNVWKGQVHRERQNKAFALQASFTSASHEFLSFLLKRLRGVGIQGGSLFRIKMKNASRLTLATQDALKLAEFMYNADCKLYLPRKREVFVEFGKICGRSSAG